MKTVEYKLYHQEVEAKGFISDIVRTTDEDFVPKISEKYDIDQIVDKFCRLAYNLIAFVDNVPAGLVAFYFNESPKHSYLSYIAVKADYRGLHIGRGLEERCISFCRDNGSAGIDVNMRKSNNRLFESRLRMGWHIKSSYPGAIGNIEIVDLHIPFS